MAIIWQITVVLYRGHRESFILLFFFYEKILQAKKSIKSQQTTFTHIFYAHKKHKKHQKYKKHKKHKKRLLLTYFMLLKKHKSDFCGRFLTRKKKIIVFYSVILGT